MSIRNQDFWLQQCQTGGEIPRWAIVDYQLGYWFDFVPVAGNRDCYLAEPVERAQPAQQRLQ